MLFSFFSFFVCYLICGENALIVNGIYTLSLAWNCTYLFQKYAFAFAISAAHLTCLAYFCWVYVMFSNLKTQFSLLRYNSFAFT